MDKFDKIRNIMFQTYQRTGKIVPVLVGLNWFASFEDTNGTGIIPHIFQNIRGGHATTICGWKK